MDLKKYITERNLLYILIGLLLITTAIDMWTAFTSPIFEIAEMNPIYMLTGTKAPLVVLTIIITLWIIKNISKSISIFKIFLFTLMTIYLTVGHSVGAYSNILATQQYEETIDPIEKEELIQDYREYDTKDKFMGYFILVGIVMLLPILLSMIAFYTTMYFYNKRKPQRDIIIDEIYKLSSKLKVK